MGSNKGRKDTKKASEILDESLERMMPPLERTEDTILSGFKNLDEGTDGFRKGTITIIGGRPAQGKTTLAKCIIQDKSLNDAVPTAYFVTKDMSAALNGLILGEADVPPYKVKKGMVSAEEKTEIYNTASKFEDVPLFLDDRSIKTISRLKKRIEQLNEKHEIEFVVIDSLQDIRAPEEEGGEEEQAKIMRVLKNIVEETNISLILLSEISDGVEYRDSFRPKLINVGTSDAVTDLADLVILMYRPYYYTGDEDMEGETELIVAKNSRGPRFTALVYFNNELMRFEEFDAGERF